MPPSGPPCPLPHLPNLDNFSVLDQHIRHLVDLIIGIKHMAVF